MKPKPFFSPPILSLWLLHLLVSFTRANIVFDPVHKTCDSGRTSGQAILNDVTNLGQFAHDTLDNWQNGKLTAWDHYRTTLLFDAFFDGSSAGAQDRYNTLKDNLATMAAAGSTSENIHVACNDAPFFSLVPGQPATQTSPATSNTLTFHNPNDGVDYPGFPGTMLFPCASGRNLIGYRWHFQGIEWIFMCTAQHSQMTPLLQHHNIAQGDSLESKSTWSTSFFHELSHALIPSSGVAAGGERYGWQGTQEVRTTYATENPDSMSYFSFAIALDPWLWNTGQAQTTAAEYQRLQRQQSPVIQQFGLTP